MATATVKPPVAPPVIVLELSLAEAEYVSLALCDTSPHYHGLDLGNDGHADPVWDALNGALNPGD